MNTLPKDVEERFLELINSDDTSCIIYDEDYKKIKQFLADEIERAKEEALAKERKYQYEQRQAKESLGFSDQSADVSEKVSDSEDEPKEYILRVSYDFGFNRKKKIIEDCPDEYRVVSDTQAIGGIIVYGRYGKRWVANPQLRHLVVTLMQNNEQK